MQKEAGKLKIGILSLQGGVIEHINHILDLGHEAIEVKKIADLNDLDGIIIPGGESTTMGKLLKERELLLPLKEMIISGLPVWGTCAGMILLANSIENSSEDYLQVIDIKVKRNAYGSQIDSFEKEVIIEEVSNLPIPLVFIRAPIITEVFQDTKIICTLDNKIVAVRQKNKLATAFHPELTSNLEFHKYFLAMCAGK